MSRHETRKVNGSGNETRDGKDSAPGSGNNDRDGFVC
jgi:hypothetical protein